MQQQAVQDSVDVSARPSSRTIMYFCYGPQLLYDQTVYSILSLLHVTPTPGPDFRIVVYCDRPTEFAALPVETIMLDQATLDGWLGGSDYIHRRKTCVIIDALERFGGKVIFLDSDTYWKRPADALFDRVGPGKACFHIAEGFLQSTGTPFDSALARQLTENRYVLPSGPVISVGRTTIMWNTGVVGIDASDMKLMNDALKLSDDIWAGADPAGAYGKKIHHAEQFAMGYAFRDCRLSEAGDCVYHYWPAKVKSAFSAQLASARARLTDLSPTNLTATYDLRYRETGLGAVIDSGKMLLRKIAMAASISVKGVRRSV